MNNSIRVALPYKKTLCFDFENKGKCVRGNNCRYAHGRAELKAVESHKK